MCSCVSILLYSLCFFKQKTAYEMRISDWSSDVCSSDLAGHFNSSVSIPASEIYAEEGIVQITPASTNPQLTEQGFSTVFRTCGRDDQQTGRASCRERVCQYV